MKIAVCFKYTPDSRDIKVLPDGSLSFDQAEWVAGEYDLVAIEAAAQATEKGSASLSALSVGGKQLENTRMRKNILSRGCDDLYLVEAEALENADSYQTARALAFVVKEAGDFDLVICGEGSADLYCRQVGMQLGELLERPVVNAVDGIVSVEPDSVTVERLNGSRIETLKIALPAVLCVTADICESRIPKMQDVLKAGKKPVRVVEYAPDSQGSDIEILSTKAPLSKERKGIVITGSEDEIIDELLDCLRNEGLLTGVM